METREEMERRMDRLAREYAATHDPKIKAELEELSKQLEEMIYGRGQGKTQKGKDGG